MVSLVETSDSIIAAIWRWLRDKGNLTLLIAFVLGVAMRFHGLMWDAPYFFNPDEARIINWAAQLSYPNSPDPAHGNAPLYFVKWAGYVTPLFGEPTRENIYHVTRILIALLGSLNLLVCYLLARKAYGKSVGVLAAIFTTFTVLHIQFSHFYALEQVLLLFTLLALYFSLVVAKKGDRSAYVLTGIFIGMAVATRLNGLILVVPLITAHLLSRSAKPCSFRCLLSQDLSLSFCSIVGTFLFLNPAFVLEPTTVSYLLWALMDAKGYFRPQRALQFEGTTPLYLFDNLLFWGMGPSLELLSILGIIYAAAKARKKENVVFLSFVAMYFVSIGTQRNKYIRYVLPLLPVLNILGAQSLHQLKSAVLKRKYLHWAVEGCSCLVIASSLLYAVAFTNIYSLTDSRIEASQWIRQNIEPGAVILVENDKDAYAPPLNLPEESEAPYYQLARLNFDYLYKRSPIGARSYLPAYVEKIRDQLIGTYGQEEILGLMSDDEKWEYIRQRLQYSDYIVFSERNYDLYRRLPALFPVENRYYRQLFAGQLGFELLKVFERDPNLFGVSLDDSEAELTFKIFDHPTIWIFKRWSAASVEPSIVSELTFANKIRLLGCDWDPRRTTDSQDELNLTLYWQAMLPIDEDYEVLLKVINGAYKVWGQQGGQPVRGISPTYTWREGQIIKDHREIQVLPGTPPGIYHVEVILYDVRNGVWVESDGGPGLLGPVEITRRSPPPVETLDIEHRVEANLGGKVQLLGYNLASGFRPGDGIHLTLFWRALQEMDKDYTVFTHLVDDEGNIWAQKDNPPVDGFYPTSRWEAGEIVRDQYDILISPETLPGEYQLEVGMYLAETGDRLEMLAKDGNAVDNRILLRKVQVRE